MGQYNLLVIAPTIPIPDLAEPAAPEATLRAVTAILGREIDFTADSTRLRAMTLDDSLNDKEPGIWAGRYDDTLFVAPMHDFDEYDAQLRSLPAGLQGLRVLYESVSSSCYVDLVTDRLHRRYSYSGMTGETYYDEGMELPFEAALKVKAKREWASLPHDRDEPEPCDTGPGLHWIVAEDFTEGTVRWATGRDPWLASSHCSDLPSIWDLEGYYVPLTPRAAPATP